jgi:hypothetical protein
MDTDFLPARKRKERREAQGNLTTEYPEYAERGKAGG